MTDDQSASGWVPSKRQMTLHDRAVNRIAPESNLYKALAEARELQMSESRYVQVAGWVAAGQVLAELRRRWVDYHD